MFSKALTAFTLAALIAACNQAAPNATQVIKLANEPSLSREPIFPPGYIRPENLINLKGVWYGYCMRGSRQVIADFELRDCRLPSRKSDYFQGSYRLVVYGPGWDPTKVTFRRFPDFTNFGDIVSSLYGLYDYTDGCRNTDDCRHYFEPNRWTDVLINLDKDQHIVFFYLEEIK